MTEPTAAFVPPAAEGLPPGVLDSAADGASALDAWARDPRGLNFLAHALVQLARDGWLRTEPGEGFETVQDRETPEPQDAPAVSAGVAPADRPTVLLEIATTLDQLAETDAIRKRRSLATARRLLAAELRRMAVEPAPATGHDDSETEGEAPCCSDPTCACIQVNAAGRCECARWDAGQPTAEQPAVVHGCPPDGSGLTPCCGRTPFELPLTDRISSEAPVTCTGPAAGLQPKEA